MGWIQIILLVIKYGPAIVNLVSEIIELIKKLRSQGRTSEARFAESSLRSAVLEYKKKQDRRLLHGLRDRLRRDCYGPDCA